MFSHVASYFAFKGVVPEGKHVLHACDNRSCVNPEHLFLGTQSDNMQDCADKGRLHLQKRKANGDPTLLRRWRRARPHCGGWWEWMEGGRGDVVRLLLTDCGQEVAEDDAVSEALGRDIREEENYWEGTATDQKSMPGLWRICK
jgi:hypothetical protein